MAESFGERLKTLRKKAGLTQPELAYLVGVHETTIRRWESNDKYIASIDDIKKLARALGVSVDDLLHENRTQSKGWVLTVRIANDFQKEAFDLTHFSIPNVSCIITTPDSALLTLGGSYDEWADNDKFKKIIADLKKFRSTVIQNGIDLGGIKN